MGRRSTLIVCAALALAGCTRPNEFYGGGTGGGGNAVADLAVAGAHDLAAGEVHDLAVAGAHDLAVGGAHDLAEPVSCAPSCSRCVTGACCGNSCCGSGEWCDKGTCRCGDGPACGIAQSCGGGQPGAQCGVKCCTGGVLCP